jgi:hypothetical protein
MLIVVDEVVDEVPSVDENFAAAQMRAKLYNATSGAIPNRGETEEAYLNCIEGIVFGENEARKTRSSRGGGRRNLETTMACDEVGAAGEVRKQYNHVKGNKLR